MRRRNNWRRREIAMRTLVLSLGLVALGASASRCVTTVTAATAGPWVRKTDGYGGRDQEQFDTRMRAIELLLGSTQDGDPVVRRHAVAALAGAQAPDNDRAAHACLEAVGDADALVRNAAALALEKMGPRALSVYEGLRARYYATNSVTLRVRLARALRSIRTAS
jgi:hypothetical protein